MSRRGSHRTVHYARTPVPSAEQHGWLRACDPTNGGLTGNPEWVTCGACRSTVFFKDPELATVLPVWGERETEGARQWALAMAWPTAQKPDGTRVCAARRRSVQDMRFSSGWRYDDCGEPLPAFGNAMEMVKAILAHAATTAHERR